MILTYVAYRNPHSSRINDVALLSHQVTHAVLCSPLLCLLRQHELIGQPQAATFLQNGVYTVGGSIQTPVSTSHVYDMLIDYPNLNRVFSSIDECHTLSEQSALQLLQVRTVTLSCHLWQ